MTASRLALALALVAAPALAADVVTGPEEIVSKDRIAQVATVRDVVARDGQVSGVVVNRSSRPIRDVQLRIRDQFLWNDEFHPGDDSASRSDVYDVPGEIPPGGTLPFTYRGAPLPARTDGHFETSVEVAGATELSRPTEAPVAGARPADRPPAAEHPADTPAAAGRSSDVPY